MSHLTRGAWIEIAYLRRDAVRQLRRTSHEVRGLKWQSCLFAAGARSSHLTRGAWIEILFSDRFYTALIVSHLTRGAWIEMEICQAPYHINRRRTSHEVRGLKFLLIIIITSILQSHLTRGAWIEISPDKLQCCITACRTSHEVRGLKSIKTIKSYTAYCRTSHEVRGLKFLNCQRGTLSV